MATPPQYKKLREVLLADSETGAQWYGVIDAALDTTLPARAKDAGLKVRSLYTGQLGELAAPAAPIEAGDIRRLSSACGTPTGLVVALIDPYSWDK